MLGHRRALVVLLALTITGGALRVEASSHPSRYQSVDERAYARLARNIVRFGTYRAPEMSDPTRWAPGAPVLFAVSQRVRPRTTTGGRWDVPSAYMAQAAVGTALIPAVFLLAALLAGPAAGVLAAGAVAFYPPLVSASGDLLSEPLGGLAITVALIAVVLALRRPRLGIAAVAGALLGLAVLARADLLLAPFALTALIAGVAWRRGGRPAGVRVAAGALAGLALTIGVWSAYASVLAGRPVPVSSGGASNLYVGTYLPGGGTMFGLKREWAGRVGDADPALRGTPFWRIPQKKVIDAVAAERPGLDREPALRAAALENLRRYAFGDPMGFLAMAAHKVERLWLGYTVGTYRHERAPVKALHIALVLLGALGLAAGLALRRGRAPELWALALVVLYITAMNVLLVAEARHNLPYMPLMAAGGAAGLALARRRAPRPVVEPTAPAITVRRLKPPAEVPSGTRQEEPATDVAPAA